MVRFARQRPDSRGQALVEFALVVSLFIVVVIGIFEGARAIYTYNALSNAAREAVREAVVHQDDAAIEAEADRILRGLANATTFVHDKSDCTPVSELCMYRVELSYTFEPILLDAIWSPVISADAAMPVENKNP